MEVVCPHCGTQVSLDGRLGLSGALCAACNEVVAAPAGAVPAAAPKARRTRGPEGPAVCHGCGEARDRAAHRCGRCGANWFYRTVAAGPDERVRGRLVDFVLHRQLKAESREEVAQRFAAGRGVVVDRVTEAQALKVRQEVEALGAEADVERDVDAVVRKIRKPLSATRITALVVMSVTVLALGIWSVVPPAPEAPPPQPRVAEPAETPTAEAAPAPSAEPSDALEGVTVVQGSPGRPVFFIDPDGWLVGPSDLGVGAKVRVGEAGHDVLSVQAAPGLGVSLYRIRARAPFALSLGDAARLAAGGRVYVADPFEGALIPAVVARPDHALGRLVYVRLKDPLDARLDSAPVIDQRGLVVGVYQRAVSERAGSTLVLPVNQLNEGSGALLSVVQPARKPSKTMTEWLGSALAADRDAKPDLYAAIEETLLLTVDCPGATCAGRVGVITMGAVGEAPRGLEARFLGVGQAPADTPLYGGTQDVRVGGWQPAQFVDGEPLLGSLPRGIRARLLSGAVADVRLLTATYEVSRPMAAGGKALQIAFAAGSRVSVPRTVGAESAQVRGEVDDVEAR